MPSSQTVVRASDYGRPVDLDALLQTESARFLAALHDADPSTPVPSCPDWTAADLAFHLAEVQSFWTFVLIGRPAPPTDYVEPPRPGAWSDLLELVDDAATGLQQALARADDADPAWTWFPPDHTVGFTRRRQVHEAFVHRLDAEACAGTRTAVDPLLAEDGVAEVVETMFSQAPPWADHAVDGPTGLIRSTDTGRDWLVRVGRWSGTSPNSGTVHTDRPTLTQQDVGPATFTLSGAAADLDAWLWNRPAEHEVVLDGEGAEAFAAVIRTGVQ